MDNCGNFNHCCLQRSKVIACGLGRCLNYAAASRRRSHLVVVRMITRVHASRAGREFARKIYG